MSTNAKILAYYVALCKLYHPSDARRAYADAMCRKYAALLIGAGV